MILYEMGELRIRALRRAEQALGARLDLRRFHDAFIAGEAR